MAIQIRNAEDTLHRDTILSKVTEYDIFKHYCSPFKEFGVPFCSDIRVDSSPTVSIIPYGKGLLYRDFGSGHSLSCFDYVMRKHNISYIESLKKISRDFGLGLTGEQTESVAVVHKVVATIDPKPPTVIRVKRRDWNEDDRKFWTQFGISKKTLLTFKVHPIQYYWLNEARFKSSTLSYVYVFSTGYKIYSPYDTDTKWFSSASKECIQGYDQLPEKGEIVILTSSLKDVMSLYELNYPSVALQSEMEVPSQDLIDDLKSRFTYILLLYDNDYDKGDKNPGQTMAVKICDKYNLINICIPDLYESKDVSDLIKNHDKDIANNIILNNLPWKIRTKVMKK